MEGLQKAEREFQQLLSNNGVVDLNRLGRAIVGQYVVDHYRGFHLGLAFKVEQVLFWLYVFFAFEAVFELLV